MSGYKQGEWHVVVGRGQVEVCAGPGSFLVATIHQYDDEDAYAVAAGIVRDHAAAPNLLAACQAARAVADGRIEGDWLAMLDAAIAKAEGR